MFEIFSKRWSSVWPIASKWEITRKVDFSKSTTSLAFTVSQNRFRDSSSYLMLGKSIETIVDQAL
jgi:hypothetical protein